MACGTGSPVATDLSGLAGAKLIYLGSLVDASAPLSSLGCCECAQGCALT